MTPAEFAARVVGVPWVRWASEWDRCDCFGLIVLYYREVMGVDLGAVPQTDIASGFAAAEQWEPCAPEPGACAWMAWHSGAPSHCGILLGQGQMLHAHGSVEQGGSVRVTRLAVMARMYDDITFMRPRPC